MGSRTIGPPGRHPPAPRAAMCGPFFRAVSNPPPLPSPCMPARPPLSPASRPAWMFSRDGFRGRGPRAASRGARYLIRGPLSVAQVLAQALEPWPVGSWPVGSWPVGSWPVGSWPVALEPGFSSRGPRAVARRPRAVGRNSLSFLWLFFELSLRGGPKNGRLVICEG